jgi:hypothetical protein
LAAFPRPNVPCDPSNIKTTSGKTVLDPGYYTGNNFPGGNADYTLKPGIYCIAVSNGFNVTSGSVHGSDVLIYMISGGVTWNSDSSLTASTDPNNPFQGLLLAMAPDNRNTVDIQGNGGATFTGTILAPESLVKLAGASGSTTQLYNQIIADQISITGGAGLFINFQANQQWEPPVPPAIEMNQ